MSRHGCDEAAFQAALNANPSDCLLKLVFADWLEEHGDDRAIGYRWLGENRKWPYHWATHPTHTGYTTFDWNVGHGAHWAVPEHCQLPSWLWHLLSPNAPDRHWLAYSTRQEAEEAVCQAVLSASQVHTRD